MNWLNLWEVIAREEENLFLQVGRVSRKKKIDTATLRLIAQDIQEKLALSEKEKVLDVCCGNGMLTVLIAPHCKSVTGLDFSPTLIQTARLHHLLPNTKYLNGDACHLSSILPEKYDKILLYFSFQYFDTYKKGKKVIGEMLKVLEPEGVILIGDVPDYALYGNHYRTIPEKMRFHYEYLTGKNQIGKFWKEKELLKIAEELELTAERLTQPETLPYSHYRRDYLLKRK